MSTNERKNNQGDWMFPLSKVATIHWGPEDAVNLKRIRKAKKLSIRTVCQRAEKIADISCSHNTLYKLEARQVQKTNPLLVKALADAMEVSLNEVLGFPIFIIGLPQDKN